MNSFRQRLDAFFLTYHRNEIPTGSLTRAAVLVPIFEKSGEPHFLLTKRTEDVEHHKGQISFPGGAVDRADGDIIATALRESEEEVGLHAESVAIVGIVDDITVPSGFVITPVVGYIAALPPLKVNKNEVECLLEIPLSIFLEPDNKRVIQMMRDGVQRDVFFFNYGESEIWGATAAIINSFLANLYR